MKRITDPKLIEELNRSREIQSSLMRPPIEKIEDKGALNTFGRSAFNAIPGAIGNVMQKIGLTNPEVMQEALYGKGEEGIKQAKEQEEGAMAHPLADIGGGMVGFGPLGAGTSAALRSVPFIGKAVKAASPSLLKRSGLHALEGGAVGSLYAPEGQGEEGFGLGALIGGVLGGPGVSAYRNLGKYREQGRNVANIEELRANRDTAHQAHIDQQAIIDAIKKNNLEQGAGLGSPEGITRQINQRLNKMSELEPSANIPHEPTEHLLNWPGGEELIPEAMNQKNMGLKEIEHYLRSGVSEDVPLDVAAANEVIQSIKTAKSHIQKNYYEPVNEYTKKNHVQLPRTVDIKHIEDQLSKISSDPIFQSSPGFEKLKQEMIKQSGGHDLVPANDFVNQWKETKQAASKARRKGFQEGGENQPYWQDQAAKLKELADQQLQILEHHLPKEYYDKLIQADKLWKEEIAPFYGNKIYEQAKKLGRIDVADIPKELRGSGMGQEKMLELFLANPKLTRLALAHTHAKNPEGILNPSAHEHAFINKLPSLQGMIERSKRHQKALNIAKAQYESLQSNRERTEIGHKEIVKKQLERQKAIKEKEKLKNEISNFDKKRKHLSEELKKGKITKQEFDKLDKEYNDAIKSKTSILKKIGRTVTYASAGVGVGAAIKKIMGQ